MEAADSRAKGIFLRRPTAFCRTGGVLFAAACSGVVWLVLVYHWPVANVPVYYFTLRPAGLWFGAVAPFLFVGAAAVRGRWFLIGCALWAGGLAATEDVVQFFKFGSEGARDEFGAARMAFWTCMKQAGFDHGRSWVPLRIVSWNVSQGGRGAGECARELASLDPDIVLLQEFGHRMPEGIEAVRHFDDYYLEGDRQSILSRYPVTPVEDGPLPADVGTVFQVRVAAGLEITCISLHLTPQEFRRSLVGWWPVDKVRGAISRTRLEFEELNRAILRYAAEGTVVVGGDFNVPPNYPDLRRATAGFVDCFAENGYGWGKTAPARLPAVRVDMIFVPHNAKVYYAAAVPTELSDHYMTLAEALVPVQLTTEAPERRPDAAGRAVEVRARPRRTRGAAVATAGEPQPGCPEDLKGFE